MDVSNSTGSMLDRPGWRLQLRLRRVASPSAARIRGLDTSHNQSVVRSNLHGLQIKDFGHRNREHLTTHLINRSQYGPTTVSP